MEIYLVYFLKVIALQTILFGLYWLISRKSSSFHFNRYFLLSILIVPFFIPFLRIQLDIFSTQLNPIAAFEPLYIIDQSLPGVVLNGGQAISTELSWWIILIPVIYLMVAIPFTIKFIIDYIRIHNLGKRSTKQEVSPKGYQLLYVHSKILSFSFLNKIFLSDLFPLKPQEKNAIITHEEYHLSEKHTIDIIIAELIRILCWFNPVIIQIQKNMKETHEYLADRHTIIQHGKNDYTTLLKSFKWHEINMMLGSGYSGSSIKNRLKMIDNSNKKNPYMKTFMLTLIAVFTAFMFACEDKLDSFEPTNKSVKSEILDEDLQQEIEKRVDYLKKQNAPQDMIDMYTREQNRHPEYLYRAYVLHFANVDSKELLTTAKMKARLESGMLENEIIYIKKVEHIENNRKKTNDFFSDETESIIRNRFAFVEKVDRLKLAEYKYKMDGDPGIREDYDTEARFKGGPSQLAQYLKLNMKYPEEAKILGIEDKVVLSFVVSKNGGLIYVNIVQEPATSNEEVGTELMKAAFHAIKSTSGMWQPAEKDGKYVMTRMTLPIEFKLDK